jgi:mono/diheme cytochrome c family protein
MAVQPSVRPDEASAFFSDGRAQRPLPEGTVARGHLRIDRHLFTGKRQASESKLRNAVMNVGAGNPLALLGEVAGDPSDDVDTFPFPVTRQVLEHGRDRYMIFCVVCHDPAGTGHGKIVERGYTQPPSFHIERLRNVAVGHFFEVMTNGYGSMPEYKQQIPPRDRWAIAAYVRALQLSQHFPIKDLPPELRQEWENHPGGAAND